MTQITPSPHIVWSTNIVDLSDPFQRKWCIRQVLLHGRAEDVRDLDVDEVALLLEDLHLPPHVHSLWKRFLEGRRAARYRAVDSHSEGLSGNVLGTI
jgi:hypothetical protein